MTTTLPPTPIPVPSTGADGTPAPAAYRPAGTAAGLDELRALVSDAIDVLQDAASARVGPVAAGGPQGARVAAQRALAAPLLPASGADPVAVLDELVRPYAEWSVDITHPAALARMQCPPTTAAVAAELVTATLNQSLHAWESGPFALELDTWVVAELTRLVGFDADAGGTLTAGGSVSNLMAMVAARDTVLGAKLGRLVHQEGLAGVGARPVVLCSDLTHFSISRATRVLGVGEDQLLRVPTDAAGRMVPEAADRMLADLPTDTAAFAIAATAGSTDLGIVDPLPELAAVARRHGVWLHADAAYGAGALFSPRLRPMLDGLAAADSVTMDLHKFGWTPASSAVLLVRRAETLASFGLQPTTCLTSDDDTLAGYVGHQGTSLQTTRRCDALKIAVTMRALGADAMATMVEGCHALAGHAADRIAAEPRLELAARPPLTAVLFRYLPDPALDADAFNGALRRRIMAEGRALLARTHLAQPGGTSRVYLKLMLLNPATTPAEIDDVLDMILAVAADEEAAAMTR